MNWIDHDPIVVTQGYVYWGGRGITRMPVAGGRKERISEIGPNTIDIVGGRLYAIDQRDVYASGLDGSASRKIADFDGPGTGAGWDVVVDGDHAYLLAFHRNDPEDADWHIVIGRTPITGGKVDLVVQPSSASGFTVLDGEIFWTKEGQGPKSDGGLHRCDSDGSHDVVVAAGVHPRDFARDARRIFFAGYGVGVFKLVR